jgi:hypothetical protein
MTTLFTIAAQARIGSRSPKITREREGFEVQQSLLVCCQAHEKAQLA